MLQVEQVVMSSTAGVVWDASKGLCDFLEAKPELVCGQRVIELVRTICTPSVSGQSTLMKMFRRGRGAAPHCPG